ncbi:acyl carrier protein [Streptomyces sp. NPDC059680]|uniref:acyl carrier protein n=1 Tax=Streptomyces sp. NPDC059680 TaxID=3346904 RepID=UPI0036CAE710
MPEMSECHVALAAVLATTCQVPAESIVHDTTLDELGLDSLAIVETFMALQEQWNVPLDESHARPEHTIAEIVGMLEQQLEARRNEARL